MQQYKLWQKSLGMNTTASPRKISWQKNAAILERGDGHQWGKTTEGGVQIPKDVYKDENKKWPMKQEAVFFFAAMQIRRKPLKKQPFASLPLGGAPGGVGVAPDGEERDIGEHVRVAHRESEAPAVGGGGRGAGGEWRDERASAAAGGGGGYVRCKPRKRKK